MAGIKNLPQGPRPLPSGLGVLAGNTVSRSEGGVGGMLVWANKLWWTTYTAENAQGTGIGIWSMGEDGLVELAHEHNECHTGRATYGNYAILGRYRIDLAGAITTIPGFASDDRVCAWSKAPVTTGLDDAAGIGAMHALTMEGKVYKLVVNPAGSTNWSVVQIADAASDIGAGDPHFKAMMHLGTSNTNAHLVVAANGSDGDGRLRILNRNTLAWTTISTDSWIEAVNVGMGKSHGFAFGHDHKSVLMYVFDNANPGGVSGTNFRRLRLPFGSDQWVQMYQQEWMRFRGVETERLHGNMHGLLYELSPFVSGTTDSAIADLPRIEPMARYSRTITDWCNFAGALVLGGNHLSAQIGNLFPTAGQSNASLLFTHTDDLWSWGRPRGYGYLWKGAAVAAGEESLPILSRGFGRKHVVIFNGGATATTISIYGWYTCNNASLNKHSIVTTASIAPGASLSYSIDDNVACDWLSLVSAAATTLTARVDYSA